MPPPPKHGNTQKPKVMNEWARMCGARATTCHAFARNTATAQMAYQHGWTMPVARALAAAAGTQPQLWNSARTLPCSGPMLLRDCKRIGSWTLSPPPDFPAITRKTTKHHSVFARLRSVAPRRPPASLLPSSACLRGGSACCPSSSMNASALLRVWSVEQFYFDALALALRGARV